MHVLDHTRVIVGLCGSALIPLALLPLQSLPLILGLAGLGGGLYYAKQQGMLDGMLGAPPLSASPAKVSTVISSVRPSLGSRAGVLPFQPHAAGQLLYPCLLIICMHPHARRRARPAATCMHDAKPDYGAVRSAIADILEKDEDYDDGHYGPILVRLAWHASGSYDKASNTGGSNGATMR